MNRETGKNRGVRSAAFPVVVTAPSGTGKTSICRSITSQMRNVVYSVSMTTRKPRRGEREGRDYIFVSEGRFRRLAASGRLAEWAEVYESRYGTPRKWLEDNLVKGRCVLLALDHNGGAAIRKKYPGAVLVFILPPSMRELERRLKGRRTDPDSSIEERLRCARKELKHVREYDYLVVNRDLHRTVSVLKSIITAEGHRRERFGKIRFPQEA